MHIDFPTKDQLKSTNMAVEVLDFGSQGLVESVKWWLRLQVGELVLALGRGGVGSLEMLQDFRPDPPSYLCYAYQDFIPIRFF